MEIVLSIITAMSFAVFGIISTCVIYEEKIKITRKTIFSILIYSFLFYISIFYLDTLFSTFFLCFIYIPLLKYIFKKELLQTTVLSLIIYSVRAFLKVLLLLFNSELFEIIGKFNNYNGTKFLINIWAIIIGLLIIFISRKYIKKFVIKVVNCKHSYFCVFVLFVLDIIFISLIKITYLEIDLTIIRDFSIIVMLIIVLIFSMDKEAKYNLITNYYNEIFEYSKLNEDLNVEYRMRLHENKNQLLLIKGMNNGKNKELESYVDKLLDEHNKDIRNYWLSDLKHLPLLAVRNFLNYKLVELKNLGAVIEVQVSNDLDNVTLKNITPENYSNLATVLGVVLDNMIESIKEQNQKLVSINIYLDGSYIVGEFVNSFDGEINLDKIFKKGYSSKGGQHGVGLTLLRDIVEDNKNLFCNTKIIDNFFVQEFKIKMDKFMKISKNH